MCLMVHMSATFDVELPQSTRNLELVSAAGMAAGTKKQFGYTLPARCSAIAQHWDMCFNRPTGSAAISLPLEKYCLNASQHLLSSEAPLKFNHSQSVFR